MVRGHLHDPPALPKRKSTWYSSIGRVGGLRNRSVGFGEKKTLVNDDEIVFRYLTINLNPILFLTLSG